MAEYIGGTKVADLNVNETIELIIKPGLMYDNVLTGSALNIYNLKPGVLNKAKMSQLSHPRFTLKPKESCNDWNPTIRGSASADEIVVSDYELEGEMCPDEFSEGCLRNLENQGREKITMSGRMTPWLLAIATLARSGMIRDIARIAHFADPDFGTDAHLHSDVLNFDNLDADEEGRAKKMLSHGTGYWAEIEARDASGQLKVVPTNNGTVGSNTMLPAGAKALLIAMWKQAPPMLKNWNKSRANMPGAMYLVQDGIFNGVREYLETTGRDRAESLIFDGEPVLGVLMFRGYPVVCMPEWEMFDHEFGMIDDNTGFSKVQRALFTVPQNLTIAYNAVGLEGSGGSALIVDQPDGVQYKGKAFMYSGVSIGAGIASDQLLVPAYNTNYNWVTE